MTTVEFFVNTDLAGDGNGLTRAATGNYWAVSFDAGNDGTSDPVVDSDTISFSTATLNAGTLRKIILLDGTWSGGNARGVIIFDSTGGGTIPGDGETITFTGSGATATTRLDGSDFWDAINSDAGGYNDIPSLMTARAGYADLFTHTVECLFSGDADETNAWDVTGTHYSGGGSLLIAGDHAGADGVIAYTGDGEYTGGNFQDASFFRASLGNTETVCNVNFVTFRRFQIYNTSFARLTGGASQWLGNHFEGMRVQLSQSGDGSGILKLLGPGSTKSCMFKATDSASGAEVVRIEPAGGTYADFLNNVIIADGTGDGLEVVAGDTLTDFYNNVIYNGANSVVVSGTITNSANNASDDTTPADIDTTLSTTAGVDVEDPANDKFRPQSGGTLDGAATAAQVPDEDVTGASFTNDNIGAFNEVLTGGETLSAESGSITLAGQTANLTIGRSIEAAHASISLAGQATDLSIGRVIEAENAPISLTGQQANISAGRPLIANHGSINFAGQEADFVEPSGDETLSAEFGALSVAGQDAGLSASRILQGEFGSVSVVGQEAAFLAGNRFDAEHAVISLSGQEALFTLERVLAAEFGSFSIAGQDAEFLAGNRFDAEHATFSLSGQEALFTLDRVLAGEFGSFSLVGQEALIRSSADTSGLFQAVQTATVIWNPTRTFET